MGRLVVVSNRLADPKKTAAGGLAVALGEALSASGGLWFGWSGEVSAGADAAAVKVQESGGVTLATVDLTPADHDQYYLGYSNGVLWPVFHYRLDLADFDASLLEGYRRVNRTLAAKLSPMLRPDDVVWIHDYHLIPLASELRALGHEQRMGFFLHVPLPPPLVLAAIPAHEWLMRCLFAHDLIGFQSRADTRHFRRWVLDEARAEQRAEDAFLAFGRCARARAFPIGIDVEEFQALLRGKESIEALGTLRDQYARRRLLVGVDRLDYSKGLPQRLRAFQDLLTRHPRNRHSATLMQVVSPSRETVLAYGELRREIERLCGAINGEHGDLDWMPVRSIHRTISRRRLPGFYRAASVALVTPLRDGMNLVAKEYVASQDPADPGVLVLSRFAGAAEQMRDALLVNPHDTQGMADTIDLALHMPLEERQSRHESLLQGVRAHDVHGWRRDFLGALAEPLPA